MSVFIWFTLNVFAVAFLESRRHKYNWEQCQRIADKRPHDRWF